MSDNDDRAACPEPVEGADLATIRERWQDQDWSTEDDGGILVTNDWSVLIDDPTDQDVEIIRLAACAPADIRTLLARLDALEAAVRRSKEISHD